MSWPAVLSVARSELRRRWRSMVALGVLAGVVGAVLTGSVALARRTVTAHERLSAATHLDDARVLLTSSVVSPADVNALPGVRESWTSRQVVGREVGAKKVAYISVISGPPKPDDMFTQVILHGRAARDDAPDEAVVPEVYADEAGIELGDALRLKLLTPKEVTQFDTGFGQPDGPVVTLRVVGISRVDRDVLGNGLGPVFATPAFFRATQPNQVGNLVLLSLDRGPDGVAAFREGLEPLSRRTPTDLTGKEFGVLYVSYPTSMTSPSVETARKILGLGLLLFVAVAGIGGLLALLQGLSRHHALGADEQAVEAALGLTRAERVTARVLPALLGAGVGVLLALAAGLATAGLEPLGALRAFEPEPGWRPDWAVLAGIPLFTGLLFLLIAAVTASRALPRSTAATLRGEVGVPRRFGLLGRAAPTAAGLSFAMSGGRGRSAVPVRTTLVAATLGVLGVVAVMTFGASLERLRDQPARYGWTADFVVVDYRQDIGAEMLRDERIGALSAGYTTTTRILGVQDTRPVSQDRFAGRLQFASVTQLKGDLPLPLVSGRAPAAPWEITLGSRVAATRGLGVGDDITISTSRGPHRARVVGIVVTPDLEEDGMGTVSVVTPQTLRSIGEVSQFATGFVQAAEGVDEQALYDDYARTLELQKAGPPLDVVNLLGLGRLPRLLAAFLALVAAGVLAHGLTVTIRRRSRDLAVLRAIGFTPRQVAGSLVTTAATVAVVGLVIGVPLGLAVGRVAWAEVATGLGMAGDASIPVPGLMLLVPIVLLGAVVIAVVPARRAARQRPAAALREE